MNRDAFIEIQQMQLQHWWYRGRYKIIDSVIRTLDLHKDAKILEIGCGTGANISLLSGFGAVTALEIDNEARKYASQFSGINVLNGWLPDGLDCIAGQRFDLICLFDVLEHIENDELSLNVLSNYFLNENDRKGKLLLTVPAYQWMWSKHDERFSHFRRYSKFELYKKLEDTGYKINYIGYMNTILFPLMLLGRLFDKFCDNQDHGMKVPPSYINNLMFAVYSLEKSMIPKISLPSGGSVIAVCESKR